MARNKSTTVTVRDSLWPDRVRHASATEIVPNRSWCHAHRIKPNVGKTYATLNICRRPGRSANRSLRSPMGCAGRTTLIVWPEATDCVLSELIGTLTSGILGEPLGEPAGTTPARDLGATWVGEFRACQNPALSPRPRGSLNRKMGSRGEAGFLRELPLEDNSKGPAESNDTVGTPLLPD